MAGPVRIKHHGTDITSDRIQGLQEFTDAEIKVRTAEILTTEFAGTTGVGSLRVDTSGAPANFTSVGTFSDTVRDDSVGTHPTDGATTTVNTYTFSQGTATATDSKDARPIRSTGDELEESTDSEIDTEIIDLCIKAMVDQTANACGQYYLSATAPSGGTWTNRGNIVDTQVDGTSTTKTLWQKTTVTTTPNDNQYRTVVKKTDDNSFQEFTEANVQSLVGRFRNRIAANNIGKYELSTAAPTGGGTWQQMGETLTDQVKDTATYAYAGAYTGSYTGSYEGTYSGTYDGSYSGTYYPSYSGFQGATGYTGSYTGSYTGAYTGSYDGSYSGTYTGYYDGLTIISTSSSVESKKLFVRIA
jgi:hypothetical protein